MKKTSAKEKSTEEKILIRKITGKIINVTAKNYCQSGGAEFTDSASIYASLEKRPLKKKARAAPAKRDS